MDIESYHKARQVELGQSLKIRNKIYLDAKFWIYLRDAKLGQSENPAANKLHHLLSAGVDEGYLICPFSGAMFFELLKQRKFRSRRLGTAHVIDQLSLGVSIANPQAVQQTEIAYLFRKLQRLDPNSLHSMQDLIWTKIIFTLGDAYPSLSDVPPDLEYESQRGYLDHIWNIPLIEMIQMLDDESEMALDYSETAKTTNRLNAIHKDELLSFEQTYDAELLGALDIVSGDAADVLQGFAETEAGKRLFPTPSETEESAKMCRNLLYHSFRKPHVRDVMRSLHIEVSLHAAMRWDKDRQFKPNDYFDFRHAVSALGYCDAFFTEKSLHHLVTRPQVDLAAVNGCEVFSNIDSAIAYLERLSNTS